MSISLFRAIAGQYTDLRGVNTVAMMNTISHQIEDQIINHAMPVDFYAGFQRFSYFPAQMRRYGRLGATCRRVHVFGVPDIRPPVIPGVEFIEVSPTSPLAREWFLLIDTPDFWATLLTQEVDGLDPLQGGRRFDGLWSYDEQVIERASLLVSQMMGAVYQPIRQRNYAAQSRHIAEINDRMIGLIERTRLTSRRRWTQLCVLQKVAELLITQPRLPMLLRETAAVMTAILKASSVAIAVSEGAGVFSIAAADGEGVTGTLIRSGEGPSGRAIAEGVTVCVADVRKQRERDPLIPGAQSLLAVPLIGRRGVYGVITLGSGEPNAWSDEDAQMVQAVAALLAAAAHHDNAEVPAQIEQARRLEQAMIKLRVPFLRLQECYQDLREEGPYTAHQLALFNQIEGLSSTLGQVFGLPKPRRIADQPALRESGFDLSI